MGIAAEPLKGLVVSIFRHAGSDLDEAEAIAEHLIDANLVGHDSHGVIRILPYLQLLQQGGVRANRKASIMQDGGALIAVDGQQGYGQVVAKQAIALGIERVRAHGVAVVGLRNASHIGRIGAWAEQAAAAGLISLHFVNTSGAGILVAPFGGSDRRLSVNPIAMGVPRPGAEPIIHDMSTGIIAAGKVRVAQNKGELVPEGCLIDAKGRPTRDPGRPVRRPARRAAHGRRPQGLRPLDLLRGPGWCLDRRRQQPSRQPGRRPGGQQHALDPDRPRAHGRHARRWPPTSRVSKAGSRRRRLLSPAARSCSRASPSAALRPGGVRKACRSIPTPWTRCALPPARSAYRTTRSRVASEPSERAIGSGGAMTLPPTGPLRIVELGVAVYRAPIARPVRTAFGSMTDRPAVIVEAHAADGAVGYGEVWCNFPTCGAEHRARLVTSFLAPLVVDRTWSGPCEAFRELSARAAPLALQAGEPGPLAQAIAGIDIALWDLAARRAGQPLWRLLGGERRRPSAGLCERHQPRPGASPQALAARAAGFRAFKLKIGFGRRDRSRQPRGGARARSGRRRRSRSMPTRPGISAEALEMAAALAAFDPLWLEEPIAADSADRATGGAWPRPRRSRSRAARTCAAMPRSIEAIAAGALAVIQPDVAKWGGITGCLPLARRIVAAGRRYCPHYLGGGIGLLASAHLLAAAGGDGMLEIDCNPNPLREGLATPFPIARGRPSGPVGGARARRRPGAGGRAPSRRRGLSGRAGVPGAGIERGIQTI